MLNEDIMFSQKVRANNFMERNVDPFIDKISKFFILTGWLVGANRLTLLDVTSPYNVVAFIYTIIVNFMMIFTMVQFSKPDSSTTLVRIKSVQLIVSNLSSAILLERLRNYYVLLNKFDNAVGYRPKTIQLSLATAVMTGFFNLCLAVYSIVIGYYLFIPLHLVFVIEMHYYGHLFRIFRHRIRFLNLYLKQYLLATKTIPEINEFVCFKKYYHPAIDMGKLLDLYCILINAHDYLLDAIKWQMVIITTTTFLYILVAFYNIVIILFNSGLNVSITLFLAIVLVDVGSMASPCVNADPIPREVILFRELIARSLFRGQLNKSCRSSARSLLNVTKAHNLSFSILRVVDISVSLPFSILGLLVTYLVIWLQFEKVNEKH